MEEIFNINVKMYVRNFMLCVKSTMETISALFGEIVKTNILVIIDLLK